MPTIKIHNTETGEVVEREMTADEVTSLETLQAEAQQQLAAAQQVAAARQALLDKLGITEDEAKLLLS